ncbi:hypothetical protein BKA67DRAFT_550334 [Truncatella angustata]|uniref:AAA+ ATPase domain-containing protein n=1 Tax=Truncatella angustata TaxID=152316 RepID=A0A9P9A2W0_9PEZI|nr:uncharacterized protein BKA67DRAFT_550334 [Truncatella angustata]KAH6661156.1 hypothetical protein BKA67DRAFT_550334 [Truncatella angustata]
MGGDGDAVADAKKIHPFFSAPKTITPDPSCSPSSDRIAEKLDTGRRKRRKTDSDAEIKQPAKRGRPRGKPTARKEHVPPADANGGNGSCNPVEQAEDAHPLAQAATPVLDSKQAPTQNNDQQIQDAKPKRILKFNPKTGTIGSPPNPKTQAIDEVVASNKTATRLRRTKKTAKARSRIADKIEEILSGIRYISARSKHSNASQSTTQQSTPPASSQETPKKRASRNTNTPKKAKVAHPFFTGKPKTVPAAAVDMKDKSKSPVKRQSIFTTTPCSPRQIRRQPSKFNLPQFGMRSGGFKFPGAQHAAWPPEGMVHVHGDERDENPTKHHETPWALRNHRKAKGRQIEFPRNESVMALAEQQLCLDDLTNELKAIDTEDFLPTPSMLRVPDRQFESGRRLQARVAPELRTWTPNDETKIHPAVLGGFNSLATTLPAFDRSTCESASWTQKYSPVRADQVLQGGKEAELLRDWLQTLKVQSVDTGTSDYTINPKSAPIKKKKRKKLDNFVVSSDEEGNLIDEISEDESAWLPASEQSTSKKTVMRSRSSKDARFTNAVLISGPHGCGKSATVYAIAKELDFDIFEISPGSRRNGKDIIDKIGDMTRNHQVSHKQEILRPDDVINEEDVARDIQSGKQGMMTAFFKPKAEAKAKAIQQPLVKEPEKTITNKPSKKLSSKSQKQSLILLEEVDILYEEDKQFWTTVVGLMAQSKRPFIMTCNNEKLVPFQSLNLHGIFRFSPAPKNVAVDHLLLIAANEGHALKRDAVESLYESRNYDLRASITELNYWCQIGVGDPKGGFGWFYPRWPKGSDLDTQGDRIRVVSSDTYLEGMGWLGRDAISNSTTSSIDEEIIRQAWENWSLDTGDCELPAREQDQTEIARFARQSRKDRLALLGATDTFYDSLSMADVASHGAYSSLDQIPLDPTLPALTSKVKEDSIIGLQYLEAQTLTRYDTTNFNVATSIRSLSHSSISQTHPTLFVDHGPLDDAKASRKIRKSFTRSSPLSYAITRYDYCLAFDPIAASEKAVVYASGHLDPSVFDRTMNMITLDIAPFVRSIVAHDQRLQADRLLRSNLLSEGGKPTKRMRSTRSALSALEGGARASTRREKYFSADLNPHLRREVSPQFSATSDEGMSVTPSQGVVNYGGGLIGE